MSAFEIANKLGTKYTISRKTVFEIGICVCCRSHVALGSLLEMWSEIETDQSALSQNEATGVRHRAITGA